MLNKATLIGRLTRDPEVRTLADGTAVASVTLAVERTFKNRNKEKETDFINCVLWNKTAEIAGKYLRKGDMCALAGRIQTRSYEDRNKKKVYVTEVVAEEMHMLGSRKESTDKPLQSVPQEVPRGGAAAPRSSLGGYEAADIIEEDVPF